jgi:hypothetical protein
VLCQSSPSIRVTPVTKLVRVQREERPHKHTELIVCGTSQFATLGAWRLDACVTDNPTA